MEVNLTPATSGLDSCFYFVRETAGLAEKMWVETAAQGLNMTDVLMEFIKAFIAKNSPKGRRK